MSNNFEEVPLNYNFSCRKCGSYKIVFRDYDFDDHEDYQYHCNGCNRTWIAEGSDY